ncbi:MAG: trypsin-like peptidase domain-containing protein [Gemmataceae bacterium]|nr:trypsin-like peptidase domain-containing protein [Gemmataceae bacterium]
MAVSVGCPECGVSFPVSEELLGKKMRCKGCQAVFVASAAKAKVGAGAPATPVRTGVARSPAGAPPAKSHMPLIAGGGAVFLVMLGVTAWALMREPSSESKSGTGPVVKVNLNDSVDEKAQAEKAKAAEKAKKEDGPPTPKAGPAWFVDAPKTLPFIIKPETSERVARSSAWIKVSTPAGGGFGSGWFAEPGIIVTNSHVVGMKEPAAPPPTAIKITLQAGKPDERVFDGQLLGLDRENDLAVIRIRGDNLPPAMPIARSSEIHEGQKLYVVGFPMGNRITKAFDEGKNTLVTQVKIRESAVSGRFPTKHGSIKYVQIEGGADPGNSGGMIVDPAGYVRCILVAGIPGSNLRFSIPSEYAIYLLQGRILRVVPAQPYQAGDKVRLPVTAMVADPLKRIKTVSLELWAGEPGRKVRPASDRAPTPITGDGPIQKIELPYNPNETIALGESHAVKGECDLPPLESGQVYWFRPKYVNIEGVERWGEAVAVDMAGLPVERKPAMLAVRHQVGVERQVDLLSHFGVGATPEGGELHLRDMGMKLKLGEKTVSVAPDGTAKVTIKYNDFGLTDEDTEGYFRQNVRGLLEMTKGMIAEMQVTKRGAIVKPTMNMNKVPVPARPFLTRFNAQTIQSLEALSLGLPDKELNPGDTWTRDANYAINISRINENALFKLTYTYVGTRVRDGREEAVIEFEGNIVRGEGNEATEPPPITKAEKVEEKEARIQPRNMYGKARGSALVDVSTGLVTLAQTHADMEFEVPMSGQQLKFGGALRVNLNRALTPGATVAKPERLLPNQEIILFPFVGAPDVSLSSNVQ